MNKHDLLKSKPALRKTLLKQGISLVSGLGILTSGVAFNGAMASSETLVIPESSAPKVQPQPHCAGLSLPPHDVHKLREVEAACLTHVGPAHAAGAGLAERRAYSRARHQRPRHADALRRQRAPVPPRGPRLVGSQKSILLTARALKKNVARN